MPRNDEKSPLPYPLMAMLRVHLKLIFSLLGLSFAGVARGFLQKARADVTVYLLAWGVSMKIIIGLGLTCLFLTGCASHEHSNAPSPGAAKSTSAPPTPRFKVAVSAENKRAAEAKALTGFDGGCWDFDPLFGTAKDEAGQDLAVCGFAHQRGTDNTNYFAYYNGELILWDEKAPRGVSVENQFLAMICAHN
jgi:hypothetical protein